MTKQISQKKIKDYPVITLNVTDIKKDPTNPNNMTLEQINGLEKSIVNFGRLKYIVVDQDNILIDGEHRLEVEKANGTTKVQVIQVPVKNEIERKMMRETLNQLHGEYDKQKQSSELLAIFENQKLDELAELLGKPREEFENLIQRYNPEISFVKEEDETKLPSIFDTESFVKRGEVWQLGRHCLMCGDNQTDLKDFIKDVKVAQLNTDPPFGVLYGEKNQYMNERYGYSKNRITEVYENDKMSTDYYEMFNNIFLNINWSEYNTIYIWCADKLLNSILSSFKDNNIYFSQVLVWLKSSVIPTRTDYYYKNEFCVYGWNGKHRFYGQPAGGDRNTVLEYNKPLHNNTHPTSKPVKMLVQVIQDGTQQDEIVLDCFAGSGSTLIACEQTNRICYAMEIDEHYCSVIIKRWEEYTNQKAIKLVDRKAREI